MKKSKISLIVSVICLIVGVLGIVSAIYLTITGNIRFSKVIGSMLLSVVLIILGILEIREYKK